MFLAFQVIVDTFSESAGAFSVNNADGFHVCDVGVIQIFVQLCNCLIYGLVWIFAVFFGFCLFFLCLWKDFIDK